MAPRLTKLSTLLAKVEATEGTDSVPVAADGLWAVLSPPAPQIDFHRVNANPGKGSLLPGMTGSRRWESRVEQMLRGSGAAYSATVKPKADAILRACGFLATGSFGVGTEKWDYTFRSDAFESFSVYEFFDAVRYKLLGCRGLPSFQFPLGGISKLMADLRVVWTDPADASNVLPTGEPTTQYPIMLSSALQIATENFAAKHGEIAIDCGRQITPRGDGTSASGFAGMQMLADRAPVLTVTAEATTEAGFPWWTKLVAGTQMDCSFQIGSVQYNRIKIVIPAMQFERLEQLDDAGILKYRAACLLVSPGGLDDELTITFD